jgi:hypothetical protein
MLFTGLEIAWNRLKNFVEPEIAIHSLAFPLFGRPTAQNFKDPRKQVSLCCLRTAAPETIHNLLAIDKEDLKNRPVSLFSMYVAGPRLVTFGGENGVRWTSNRIHISRRDRTIQS